MGLDPGFLITYHTRANNHRLNLTRFRNTCLLFLDQSGLTLKPTMKTLLTTRGTGAVMEKKKMGSRWCQDYQSEGERTLWVHANDDQLPSPIRQPIGAKNSSAPDADSDKALTVRIPPRIDHLSWHSLRAHFLSRLTSMDGMVILLSLCSEPPVPQHYIRNLHVGPASGWRAVGELPTAESDGSHSTDKRHNYCETMMDSGVGPAQPQQRERERGKGRLCKGLNAVFILLLSEILPHH
jgi:hypothetical protein